MRERRNASVRAATYCDTLYLSKADFDDLLFVFPTFFESVKKNLLLKSSVKGWGRIREICHFSKMMRIFGRESSLRGLLMGAADNKNASASSSGSARKGIASTRKGAEWRTKLDSRSASRRASTEGSRSSAPTPRDAGTLPPTTTTTTTTTATTTGDHPKTAKAKAGNEDLAAHGSTHYTTNDDLARLLLRKMDDDVNLEVQRLRRELAEKDARINELTDHLREIWKSGFHGGERIQSSRGLPPFKSKVASMNLNVRRRSSMGKMWGSSSRKKSRKVTLPGAPRRRSSASRASHKDIDRRIVPIESLESMSHQSLTDIDRQVVPIESLESLRRRFNE